MSGTALGASVRMDRIYRHQRFIYDLTRKYYLLGRDRLLADLRPGAGHVIEIGCGTGRNLAIAARRHPDARFYGIDVSTQMLESARSTLDRAGLGTTVRTALADATGFDPVPLFGRARFDRIYFSYTLSMIPDWRGALVHAASMLAPGGRLMIVDFGRQDGLPTWFRRALFTWLALFHVHPVADLRTTLDDLARKDGLRVAWRLLFRGYAVYASLDKPE